MSGKEIINKEHQEVIGPADLYERDKVPSLFRPLAHFFLEHVPLERGERVLDIACGTGIVARIVASRVGPEGQVTGVDISPRMLEVARAHAPVDGSIIWQEGDAGDLPFGDESFDLVLCQQGFQYFPDKPLALSEMHRVLSPDGRLALIVMRAVSAEHQPCQWVEAEALKRHVSLEAGEKQRRLVPFFDGDSDLLRSLIAGAGFHKVEVRDVVFKRRRGFPEDFVTEADYAHLASDIRDAVVRDIREAMVPYIDEEGTVVPYGSHIALAVK